MSFFRRSHLSANSESSDELDAPPAEDSRIDPDLRLRTVRTAHSTIAESIRNDARELRRRRKGKSKSKLGLGGTLRGLSMRRKGKGDISEIGETTSVGEREDDTPRTQEISTIGGKRRNIYVNIPLPLSEQSKDGAGDPLVRYTRNKVRTTKYTPLTFLPKNLTEQFHRVANLYFLALVLIQFFPIFGAAAPSISWLPLAFILTVTAIKDGVEDYRRGVQDERVNNFPAVRVSGAEGVWRNGNVPSDDRSWWERLWGLRKPGVESKGEKRVRGAAAEGWRAGLPSFDMEPENEEPGTMKKVEREQSMDIDIESTDAHTSASTRSRSHSNSTLGPHSYPPPKKSSSTLIAIPASPSASSLNLEKPPNNYANTELELGNRSTYSLPALDRRGEGGYEWELTLWKKLHVGDLVLLRENDQVPADIVVLSTPSHPFPSSPTEETENDGICYLETKNLDGETNLKPRRSLTSTQFLSVGEVVRKRFWVDSEKPDVNLYSYNGVFHSDEEVEPITPVNLLLRGCTLRNTPLVLGLVISTGSDTKIMLNSGSTPSKRSKIERETNFNVVVNFVILFGMCAVTAVVSGIELGWFNTSRSFFERGAEPSPSLAVDAIITFASCLIAFQNIVPISLYISIEIVKTIQAYFIHMDIDMRYVTGGGEEAGGLDTTCVPKTWNISDDLGQIAYIFSDKTGTLTQNVMEFLRCSVPSPSAGTAVYGEGVSEAQRGKAIREGTEQRTEDVEDQRERIEGLREEMVGLMRKAWRNEYLDEEKVTLISPALIRDLQHPDPAAKDPIVSFFRALALCHTVLPAATPSGYGITYKAESPDEAALVSAARDAGFPFISRSTTSLVIEVLGEKETYTPLKVLEFNSTRKRMSVVLRNNRTGEIVLYCKGADSVIYERLARDQDSLVKERTMKDMERFANEGLRTLCVAYRTLSEEEYTSWAREFDEASASVDEREERIERAQEKIERGLYILGATALEDKLQEGVPRAIEMLHEAGIKLWILTGDKLQTAIEIGYSCNLLKPDMEMILLQADSLERTQALIEAGFNKMASVHAQDQPSPQTKIKFAIVIDGETLRYALDVPLKRLFLNLGKQCETVVCCRVSPAQKALTVKLVKEGENVMTLAIGDGANDVAMIQEAHIGCGLFGLEGSQAAMSADYAFGQFRFLTKLLLVHGRWSYQRVADMHANFFYKNVIWTFAMFWFLFFNSFDATYLYEYTFILLYNLVFTSLPVIVLGAFDQDVNAKASLAFPQLYERGIKGLEYTKRKFWAYMLDGFYQSAIIFFIPYLAWQGGGGVTTTWGGKNVNSLADFGTMCSVAAIFAANQYVGINMRYWTVITWVVVYGSTLIMLLWIAAYSLFTSLDFDDEVVILFGSVNFWATLILSVVIAVGPRFIVKYISQTYWPQDRDIIREAWIKGGLKDQLGIEHKGKRKKRRTSRPPPPYASTENVHQLEAGTHTPPAPELPGSDEYETLGYDLARSSTPSTVGSLRSPRGEATDQSKRASHNSASGTQGSSPTDTSHTSPSTLRASSNPYWRTSTASHTRLSSSGSRWEVPAPLSPPEHFELAEMSPPLLHPDTDQHSRRELESRASNFSDAPYDTATEGSDTGTIRDPRSSPKRESEDHDFVEIPMPGGSH